MILLSSFCIEPFGEERKLLSFKGRAELENDFCCI
jgi:hypothetical protein